MKRQFGKSQEEILELEGIRGDWKEIKLIQSKLEKFFQKSRKKYMEMKRDEYMYLLLLRKIPEQIGQKK